MHIFVSIFRRQIELAYGPAVDDEPERDAGPGSSALLEQPSFGFAPPDYWTDDPEEPETPDEW